ncbi:MAG: GNAT family N-acetyltransferase [Spirochaetaceae bacterium]|nr:MAG: GNAT family N-acetyltransferase [Spirochaetaceae bacterium]
MEIIDLTPEHEITYFQCLEDWSEEMKEAGDHKSRWYERMKDRGLRVKLARDDSGAIGGMIQYLPIEEYGLQGRDLYFILCVWVHGYEEGRGNFQKQGMGKALLQAAEEDSRALGKKGIAAWGIMLPFWMRASWYKKRGYKTVDRNGVAILVWKPFTEDAVAPKWIRRKKKPQKTSGKVTVDAFVNGWCPAQNVVYERARRAAAQFGEKVVFRSYDTLDREVFEEWGISDGLFIDGKEVRTGPPPSFQTVRELIEKRIRKLR